MLKKKIKTILFLDLISLFTSYIAATSRGFADFYSHNIYRYVSLTVSSITGLLPFSLTEVFLYVLIIFVILDLAKSLRGLIKNFKEYGNDSSERPSRNKALIPYKLFKPMILFAVNLILIASVLFALYVFNCGINYRRTSFSVEAGIPGYDTSSSQNEANADLVELCEYLVENINLTEERILENSQLPEGVTLAPGMYEGNEQPATPASESQNPDHSKSDKPLSPVKLYNGAFIGETSASERASAAFLWETGKLGQEAMESLGTRFSRLSGHYPFPKPLINSWILSIQQVTGVYSPFTIEANYNRDIPYYDIPFTICHELSHLRGYMQEEEANFIAVLATIGSGDLYFNYSGYVSAWVYAGNALAKNDREKFSELYMKINSYTRQDMMYNNEFWDQYDTKVAEVHEEINDAYLKYNGQTQGVKSYGHVVDLMLTYFSENRSMK
ncbi:MAG: DUF3810 domain-containing protein [Oribacterium sp.]|nr:DUF3810 domain-containing protein [Oribacterium sp.]